MLGTFHAWKNEIKPVARWKKTGDSCPHCGHDTEVLVCGKSRHDSIYCAEGCWRCGWVAGFDRSRAQTPPLALSDDSEHKKVAPKCGVKFSGCFQGEISSNAG
jgi:predicted RNA-binding Zn-ribbon protein involved in translation (DUF1610 family)